jgi:hypothetical protein
MNQGAIIAIVAGALLLFLYAIWETRINQRPCPRCGRRVSRENPILLCSECGRQDANGERPRPASGLRAAWPRVVLVAIPLGLIVVDAFVIMGERTQPDTELAIRLVKESASKKENFTVQQYLYTTLYHRRDKGEDVGVTGWDASEVAGGERRSVEVRFRFSEAGEPRVATWEVDLTDRKIKSRDDSAKELSWN